MAPPPPPPPPPSIHAVLLLLSLISTVSRASSASVRAPPSFVPPRSPRRALCLAPHRTTAYPSSPVSSATSAAADAAADSSASDKVVDLGTTTGGPKIRPLPSRVVVDDLTVSFPETLMGRLFSSVPRRERALDSVTVSFGREKEGVDDDGGGNDGDGGGGNQEDRVALLVGRSGSGKSTVLKAVDEAGADGGGPTTKATTSGSVRIISGGGVPVTLDASSRSDIRNVRTGDALGLISAPLPGGGRSRSNGGGNDEEKEEEGRLRIALSRDFANVLGLTESELSSKPADLSPSGQFLTALARGCVLSSLPSLLLNGGGGGTTAAEQGVQYPILLLDEMFDFEPPSVAQRCGIGLSRLAEMGGVVLAASHRPEHWEGVKGCRCRVITMSGGRVLSDI